MIEAKPEAATGLSDPSVRSNVTRLNRGLIRSRETGRSSRRIEIQRPEEFVPPKDFVGKQIQCPFCPGNESATPAAGLGGASRLKTILPTTCSIPPRSRPPRATGRFAWYPTNSRR